MSLALCRRLGGALFAALLASIASGTTVREMSVVDLIDQSQTIVAGRVEKVTDGFDANGVPYTEITMQVMDAIRGTNAKTHTFRQFGLTKPRTMPDGRVYVGRPAGWPTWRDGEVAIVFLYPQAKHTGLQTTVGLGYGKMSVGSGNALNAHDNTGMFAGVSVNRALLDANERQMFDTHKGAIDDTTFRKFLHRAVAGNWTKNGSMTNAKR